VCVRVCERARERELNVPVSVLANKNDMPVHVCEREGVCVCVRV